MIFELPKSEFKGFSFSQKIGEELSKNIANKFSNESPQELPKYFPKNKSLNGITHLNEMVEEIFIKKMKILCKGIAVGVRY